LSPADFKLIVGFMSSNLSMGRLMVAAGGAALIVMGLLSGCGTSNEKSPSTTSTTTTTTTTTTVPPTSSAAPPAPTEKGISPTGGNLFTPPVIAPAAPTEPPGVHRRN
jgi:hypothetical protein